MADNNIDYMVDGMLVESLPNTNLARIRILYGYSQAMLSKKSGVSLRTIQQYESKYRDINKASISILMQLARALECKVEDLVDIEIDEITECIIKRSTGDVYSTCYELVNRCITRAEAKNDTKHGWKFDWNKIQENGYDIIELFTPHDNRTQGRISFKKRNGFYYVDHVESAPRNVGGDGEYVGVGANLFAIVCYLSKQAGFEGYVSFMSKLDDRLMENYKEKLHAIRIGDSQFMYLDNEAADYLINRYQIGV